MAGKVSSVDRSASADDVETNFDDEDSQSKNDFEEFKRWLDAGSPAKPLPNVYQKAAQNQTLSSQAMPPPAKPTQSGCKCFQNPCSFTQLRHLFFKSNSNLC